MVVVKHDPAVITVSNHFGLRLSTYNELAWINTKLCITTISMCL